MKYCARILPALLVAILCSCGSGAKSDLRAAQTPAGANSAAPVGLAFPTDRVLPGERLNAQEQVWPHGNAYAGEQARAASGINSDSEFAAGVDRFSADGNVSDLDQGSQLVSTLGGGDFAAAVYRLSLGGPQPGAISADVNLHLRSDSTPSSYWVGVADFGHGRWELHGPYSDAQVRVGTTDAAADYTSPLGNTFIAVIASNGSRVDVVGVGASPRSGDTTAPPTPVAFGATSQAGGVLLQWTDVLAADLAGYRIYYSYSPFSAVTDNGVTTLPYLEGLPRHFLVAQPGRIVYAAVSSVDVDGNESAITPVVSKLAQVGSQPVLDITTSILSGSTGDLATLNVSGGSSYDFDLDGDGNFEVSGNTTGTAQIVTDSPGIIRPAVRATGSDPSRVAFGSVSLLISGGAPVAVLTASDTDVSIGSAEGTAVNFDASGSVDPQGGTLNYAFDPEGDGSYTASSSSATNSFTYNNPGVYLAKVKVTSTTGGVAYDSALVSVRRFQVYVADPVNPGVGPSIAMIGGLPAIAYFDFNRVLYCRALDASGRSWGVVYVADDEVDNVGRGTCLAEVGGLPAVSYLDEATGEVFYKTATDVFGSGWNAPVHIDTDGSSFDRTSLVVVNGNPAIAYYGGTSDTLRFARSSSNTGYPAGSWTESSIGGTGSGHSPSMAIISGNPAVSYEDGASGNNLGYVRALDADGTSWAPTITISDPALPFAQNGSFSALVDVGGHPAIGFSSFDGAQGDLYYVRATNTTGAASTDWPTFTPVSVGLTYNEAYSMSMAMVGGKPAMAWYEGVNDDIRYVRSTTVKGNTAGSWPASVVADSSDNVGLAVNMLSAGNLPLIAVYAGSPIVLVPTLQ